ncbi:uncharacterized protein BX663DRAFT_511934 [Cokeromyces recurvatus]|uniref:uncharacterized protein n=1 Tax=Cokeromyces recurvatus TaxID=90255 RepID=UPI00221E5DE7|nr:uncharacterized protein BX663DRAFT_511934 [Cokeromyces recurvatus]KAI7902164.1 hypothetical protein BX663DRAFT_511934 [Cokeromyces recurvatus]
MDHFYHVLKEDPSIWSSFWDTYDTLIKIENQKEANDSKFIIINKRVFESKMELDLITMKLQNDQRPMNMADFALESRGGRILYSKTSPTSNTMAPWKFHIRRLMGLPVHYYPPKYAIQPGLYVGECWSMNGCEGTLGILLSEPILIHSVAIEYPSLHTLMDKVNQAPKDIEILGLPNYPNSGEPLSLGDITFNIHGSKNKYKSNLQLYNLDFYPEVH